MAVRSSQTGLGFTGQQRKIVSAVASQIPSTKHRDWYSKVWFGAREAMAAKDPKADTDLERLYGPLGIDTTGGLHRAMTAMVDVAFLIGVEYGKRIGRSKGGA